MGQKNLCTIALVDFVVLTHEGRFWSKGKPDPKAVQTPSAGWAILLDAGDEAGKPSVVVLGEAVSMLEAKEIAIAKYGGILIEARPVEWRGRLEFLEASQDQEFMGVVAPEAIRRALEAGRRPKLRSRSGTRGHVESTWGLDRRELHASFDDQKSVWPDPITHESVVRAAEELTGCSVFAFLSSLHREVVEVYDLYGKAGWLVESRDKQPCSEAAETIVICESASAANIAALRFNPGHRVIQTTLVTWWAGRRWSKKYFDEVIMKDDEPAGSDADTSLDLIVDRTVEAARGGHFLDDEWAEFSPEIKRIAKTACEAVIRDLRAKEG